jgi:hypothetical protein
VRRAELAELLRSASHVTGDPEPLVLGSQSILGGYDEDELPLPATASVEADLAFLDDPERTKSDLVEAALGELSEFHIQHGYYAEGVDVALAVLPDGWRARLLQSDGAVGLPRGALFLEKHDLAVGKLVAYREKDLAYVTALLDEGLLDVAVLRDRVDRLAVERGEDLGRRLHKWLDHWPGAG